MSRKLNSAKHVGIDLGDVQETLLIPLYFRARETSQKDPICRDPKACRIIDSIDYDFQKFESAWNIQMDIAVRTEIFDERVLEMLRRDPKSTIVNLGAGLDGRFERLDNGQMTWFDLDFRDAIALRKKFFHPSERNRFIASDCFDFTWMDQVDRNGVKPSLIIAEGLFCYCEEKQIQRLFEKLKERWPGCEIAFQSLCPALVGKEREVPTVNATKAVFRWGIEDGREVLNWDRDYLWVGQWFLVDRHRRRWRSIRYTTLLPWVRKWFRSVMKISQIRLGYPT